MFVAVTYTFYTLQFDFLSKGMCYHFSMWVEEILAVSKVIEIVVGFQI